MAVSAIILASIIDVLFESVIIVLDAVVVHQVLRLQPRVIPTVVRAS
jgi:hypothetical protein